MSAGGIILVTGFGPFGPYAVNPSEELAKAVGGQHVGSCTVRSVILPAHRTEACARLAPILDELEPRAILHLGLAAGRARIALERVALNVLDYRLPDADGAQPHDEPCVPGGPVGHWSRLPLDALVDALTVQGIPAYVSDTAGTYLCNQVMYWTLHELARCGSAALAGLIHVPLLPSMVAAAKTDQPSMDFPLMLRAVEVTLDVVARHATGASDRGDPSRAGRQD
jgi:pyroglutamyl-peptidase